MATTTKRLLNGWTQQESGGSGTWLWVQRIGTLLKPEDLVDTGGELPIISMKDRVSAPMYLFIEITDMVDACGRDMLDQYGLAGEVYLVEPGRYGARDLKSVFESCGWEGIKDIVEEFIEDGENEDAEGSADTGYELFKPQIAPDTDEIDVIDIGLIYADLHRNYRHKSNLHSASGGRIVTEKNLHDGVAEGSKGFSALLRELLTEANGYVSDKLKLETTLDTRVVNKLGQTSREFAGGIDSTWDTLRNIQALGDKATPSQKIVLKMYQNGGQTLGGNKVPFDIVAGEPLLRGQA